MTRGRTILLEVRNEAQRDLTLQVATIWKRLGSIEMRIGHPVQMHMVWCSMSLLTGNVVSEAEVEIKATQESVVRGGQNPRYRGQGETIIEREDRGAGAERGVSVVKGDSNGALSAPLLTLLDTSFTFLVSCKVSSIYIYLYNCAHRSPFPLSPTHVSLRTSIRLSRR